MIFMQRHHLIRMNTEEKHFTKVEQFQALQKY